MKLPDHRSRERQRAGSPPVRSLALAATYQTLFVALFLLTTSLFAEAPSAAIGNFGPTGLEIEVQPDRTIKVTGVQPGSPAAGKFTKGQVFRAINGKALTKGDRAELARFITAAEATDGVLKFTGTDEVTLQIPALGAFSPTWPVNCPKTKKIIRANADYIAKVAESGLTEHTLYNGLAILMLLSTGEDQDIDVVRRVYRRRMEKFTGMDTGPHSWHNGYQGIAVCEYYLRTGDETVMPLINAICESARKYQFNGGWTHWATSVNPQYTAGGLMNPAGTQLLTTLLLAKMCGAQVNDATLLSALKFFYRFAGHGSNPYGDHRPEAGYGSNNGKSEMLAVALNIAARSDKGGAVYALARDKNAQTPLYSYPYLLHGHTGGMGAFWHGIAAAFMIEKRPALYRNRMDQCQWFYELSRRHNGAFGMCGGERYDTTEYGYGMGLSLTAPLKTLQITGAKTSPHAKPFQLPELPWGRPADLKFFALDGGTTGQLPTDEFASIAEGDEAALEKFAAHPEHVYREKTADTIREKKFFGLIERLLTSNDPRARHTACYAIMRLATWELRFSKGCRSRYSIEPADFTDKMFTGLMKMITNPDEALWNVDAALCALAVASPAQVKSRLADILPWLKHDEWWLNESAVIALTPVMQDSETLARILPAIIPTVANCQHEKGRQVMQWMLQRATENAAPAIRVQMARAFVEMYQTIPATPAVPGIASCSLHGTLGHILNGPPETILEGARLSVARLGDMRPRERDLQIDSLIEAADKLDEAGQRELGAMLVKHYRPAVVGDNPAMLKAQMQAGNKSAIATMNKLLQIDRMAGVPGGWQLLGGREQVRWVTSFEPATRPPDSEMNRYRPVELPERLKGWFKPDYAAEGWTLERTTVGDLAPKAFQSPAHWAKDAGEVIFMRKTIELPAADYVLYRAHVFTKQGYDLYLNGQKIAGDKSRSKTWMARTHYLDKPLPAGTNVVAAMSFLEYFRGKTGNIEVYVEGLKDFPAVE
jgi:hypothetical protein